MTLTTFKIIDIACAVGHFFNPRVKIYHRYYLRGFAWAWMALRARNPSPKRLATLNPQSTCHGPRSGPNLAHGVQARAGSLRATELRAREKTRGRKRTKCRRAKSSNTLPMYNNRIRALVYIAINYVILRRNFVRTRNTCDLPVSAPQLSDTERMGAWIRE